MKDAKKTAASAGSTGATSEGFTAEERAAMQERSRELKAASRRGSRATSADGLADLLAKIAELSEPDRGMAERVHAIVMAAEPSLAPRTWYGMPAWAKDGKVVCFFQAATKFKVRYATFGFQPDAALDDGAMWPVAFALTELTPDAEARITALVRRAAG